MQFAVYVVDMNDCWPKWSNLTWRNIWKELLSLERNSQDWLRWRETIQDLNIILPTLYLWSNTGVIMEQLIELFLDGLQYCFSIGSFSINIAGGNLMDIIMLTNNWQNHGEIICWDGVHISRHINSYVHCSSWIYIQLHLWCLMHWGEERKALLQNMYLIGPFSV